LALNSLKSWYKSTNAGTKVQIRTLRTQLALNSLKSWYKSTKAGTKVQILTLRTQLALNSLRNCIEIEHAALSSYSAAALSSERGATALKVCC
jgi:hypothetical protein